MSIYTNLATNTLQIESNVNNNKISLLTMYRKLVKEFNIVLNELNIKVVANGDYIFTIGNQRLNKPIVVIK